MVGSGEIMKQNSSKMPRFFLIMLLIVAVVMLISVFFSPFVVGTAYFVALILGVVLFIFSKQTKHKLTNFKYTYFMFDAINLIAIVAVIYYEWTKHTTMLNVLLVILLVVTVILVFIDFFVFVSLETSKRENMLISMALVASMICITAYFYNVSDFWFAVIALVFSLASLGLKLFSTFSFQTKKNKRQAQDGLENTENTEGEESALEKRIHSSEEHEGEIEE